MMKICRGRTVRTKRRESRRWTTLLNWTSRSRTSCWKTTPSNLEWTEWCIWPRHLRRLRRCKAHRLRKWMMKMNWTRRGPLSSPAQWKKWRLTSRTWRSTKTKHLTKTKLSWPRSRRRKRVLLKNIKQSINKWVKTQRSLMSSILNRVIKRWSRLRAAHCRRPRASELFKIKTKK